MVEWWRIFAFASITWSASDLALTYLSSVHLIRLLLCSDVDRVFLSIGSGSKARRIFKVKSSLSKQRGCYTVPSNVSRVHLIVVLHNPVTELCCIPPSSAIANSSMICPPGATFLRQVQTTLRLPESRNCLNAEIANTNE